MPKVNFTIEYLPWGNEADVEKDMLEVDLLYLPLPFGEKYQSFSRYSLSTKMVTYLGSGIPILYHGPEDSAACQILKKSNAGVLLVSKELNIMVNELQGIEERSGRLVENALQLAHQQFLLSDVKQRFWDVLTLSSVRSSRSS